MSTGYTYRPPLGLDIRINPPREEERLDRAMPCEWPGCCERAFYPAPRRPQSRDFQWFCLEHVREYNRTWNYFSEMSEAATAEFLAGNATGHRPTWRLGNHPGRRAARSWRFDFNDPYVRFGRAGESSRREPPLSKRETQALQTLDLDDCANMDDVKTRYKALVKRYHPDANGGDTAAVERLRRVILAYQTLKSCRFGKRQGSAGR